jgi:hypothetical protein
MEAGTNLENNQNDMLKEHQSEGNQAQSNFGNITQSVPAWNTVKVNMWCLWTAIFRIILHISRKCELFDGSIDYVLSIRKADGRIFSEEKLASIFTEFTT